MNKLSAVSGSSGASSLPSSPYVTRKGSNGKSGMTGLKMLKMPDTERIAKNKLAGNNSSYEIEVRRELAVCHVRAALANMRSKNQLYNDMAWFVHPQSGEWIYVGGRRDRNAASAQNSPIRQRRQERAAKKHRQATSLPSSPELSGTRKSCSIPKRMSVVNGQLTVLGVTWGPDNIEESTGRVMGIFTGRKLRSPKSKRKRAKEALDGEEGVPDSAANSGDEEFEEEKGEREGEGAEDERDEAFNTNAMPRKVDGERAAVKCKPRTSEDLLEGARHIEPNRTMQRMTQSHVVATTAPLLLLDDGRSACHDDMIRLPPAKQGFSFKKMMGKLADVFSAPNSRAPSPEAKRKEPGGKLTLPRI